MPLSKDKLVQYLSGKKGLDQLAENSPLFSTGLLDSVSQLELIMYIEGEAGMQVSPNDLTLENFDSVEKILSYVSTRGGALE